MKDPFKAVHWNTVQVLAWACLRDRDYRADPPTFMSIYFEVCRRGKAANLSIKQAKEALIFELENGTLTTRGRFNNGGALLEIPAVQWADLKFYEDSKLGPYAAPKDRSRFDEFRWYGLRYRRKDIVATWPDEQTIAAGECSLAELVLVLLFPTCAQVEEASNDENALAKVVTSPASGL